MKAGEFFPVPSIEEGSKFLAIQPHPDDIEICAGGFIALMRNKDKEVIYVTVTDGRLGTFDPRITPEELVRIRKKEAREAASVLGVEKHIFLDYVDGNYLSHEELRRDFIRLIREEKPDGILLPDPWLPYEAHLGHIQVGLAGAEAAMFSPLPHFKPEGSPHQLSFVAFYATNRPNTFVDITHYFEKKLEAIRQHKSQFPPSVFQIFSAYLDVKAKEWGEKKAMERAEAFKVLSIYHLHINVDAASC